MTLYRMHVLLQLPTYSLGTLYICMCVCVFCVAGRGHDTPTAAGAAALSLVSSSAQSSFHYISVPPNRAVAVQ